MPSLGFWRTNPHKPTTLYAELVRRGLPADYARRTADELDDHRADLMADLRRSGAGDPGAVADERLGETRRLADRIVTDYRRRSWFGRWPVVAFVLAPIPIWIAAALAVHVVMLVMSYPASFAFAASIEGLPAWHLMVAKVTLFVLLYAVFFAVVPSLVSYGIARIALKTTTQRSWAVLASCLLAFAAATLTYRMHCSLEPGQSSFLITSPPVTLDRFYPWQTLLFYLRPLALAQMAGPLLACLLVLRSDDARRRSALQIDSDAPESAARAA